MSDIIGNNNGSNPVDSQENLHQVAGTLLADNSSELAHRTTMSVPISSLAGLGAAVSSLSPALHTVVTTTTANTDGLFTLANYATGDNLKAAKNGNYWASFKTAEGKSKFVQLRAADPINTTTTTAIPIDPTTVLMAAALYSIDQKLSKIQETQREILDYLTMETESTIEGDLQTISDIITKYKFNWDNEYFTSSNHKIVNDIQRKATENIRTYRKQIDALLAKKQLLVARNNVAGVFKDLQKKFKYYRMAVYTYSLAYLLEIMLSANFREDNIRIAIEKINQISLDYRDYFDKASLRLEQISTDALDKKVLKGLGIAGQSVGKFIGSIPIIEKSPVDEMLQASGEKMANKATGLEERAVHEFATLGNPGTAILVDRLQDMIQIYNHTTRICFDKDHIYLVS